MDSESLQAIFDPVVDRIIKLVEKQVISIELKGENVTVRRSMLKNTNRERAVILTRF